MCRAQYWPFSGHVLYFEVQEKFVLKKLFGSNFILSGVKSFGLPNIICLIKMEGSLGAEAKI